MAHKITNGATVETTALYVKSVSNGNTFYRRLPFNIEVRTYPSNSAGGRKSYFALTLGGGTFPGRANTWDQAQGEEYDAVVYYDTYPSTWPRIGNTAG